MGICCRSFFLFLTKTVTIATWDEELLEFLQSTYIYKLQLQLISSGSWCCFFFLRVVYRLEVSKTIGLWGTKLFIFKSYFSDRCRRVSAYRIGDT
jgi:hypothetical protein